MIQIDMFEVQLGAAVLLRFDLDGGDMITVLADAGTHGGGYGDNHVKDKLRDVLGIGDDAPIHINLLIGTHYDADHLNQMNAIIKDENITIDEAWMPPVADDTEDATRDRVLGDESLLALKFAHDFENGNVIARYIATKRRECEFLQEMESAAEARLSEWREGNLSNEEAAKPEPKQSDNSDGMEFFYGQIKETAETLGLDEHSHVELEPDDLNEDDLYKEPWLGTGDGWLIHEAEALALERSGWRRSWTQDALLARSGSKDVKQRIAWLRRSSASRAVNADALNDVVIALKKRGVPVYSRQVQDGDPRRFVWDKKKKRFVGVGMGAAGAVEFSLLGPSQSLVEKHWNKLPIARKFSLAFVTSIPIDSITPSNQLSYVLHFRSEGQGILISGDAGCVDFKPSGTRQPYYKDLLDALDPLHIVQVSHHGGANAHFYRVLLESGGRKNLISSFLLLSHETRSKYRPSDTFRKFVEKIRTVDDGPSLLFTSTPKAEKVSDFADLIHDVVGTAHTAGDASLKFDGNAWNVVRHAVDKASI